MADARLINSLSGYLTETPAPSHAHAKDWQAERFHPNGSCPWNSPRAPADSDQQCSTRCAREWYTCGYCGSMHPQDLAAAIRLGAQIHFADFKYGWPHKSYVEKAPNRYEGHLEVRCGIGRATQEDIDSGKVERYIARYSSVDGQPVYEWRTPLHLGTPAGHYAWGKFYTVHLQDASPEDRETIERAMGLRFTFDGMHIRWQKFVEPVPA